MKPAYHRQITEQALRAQFSAAALEEVVIANLGQDALRYQVGHDHFHFDNNSFEAGRRYLDEQRALIAPALARGDTLSARAAFGRLTHAAQDFYAHSNYVALWRALNGSDDPAAIDPLNGSLLQHPDLRSGRLYYPLEVLTFIPAFEPHITPRLPVDSHAQMNKDHPARPDFDLAFAAAVKRTEYEFGLATAALAPQVLALFVGHV